MTEQVSIERLTEYSDIDAKAIGRLMPFLSEKLSDEPISQKLLDAIINSPHHEQLVAKLDSIIVGTATLNLLMGPGIGRKGYLEDFVTDPSVRGQGIGDKLWNEMLRWCKEQNVDLNFTSRDSRETAHRFYKARGAIIRNTTVFHVSTNSNDAIL